MSMLTLAISIGLIAAFAIVFPRITKGLSAKLNLFIACGYLSLLIGLSAVCLLIPANTLVQVDAPTTSDEYNQNNNMICLNLSSGRSSVPDGLVQTVTSFKPKSKSIEVQGETMGINGIYIGRKGVNVPDNHTGKIDIYYYTHTPIVSANYKYKLKNPSLKLSYKGSVLQIDIVQQSNYVAYSFDDRQSAEQFYNIGSMFSIGSYELVVVLLPKGVTINGGDYSSFPTY
jgi:hypothetical protein